MIIPATFFLNSSFLSSFLHFIDPEGCSLCFSLLFLDFFLFWNVSKLYLMFSNCTAFYPCSNLSLPLPIHGTLCQKLSVVWDFTLPASKNYHGFMDANKRRRAGSGVSGVETKDFVTDSKSSSQSDSICFHWLLKSHFLKCDSVRCLFITDTRHVCPCPRGREPLPSKGNVSFASEGNAVYFPRLLAIQVCLES